MQVEGIIQRCEDQEAGVFGGHLRGWLFVSLSLSLLRGKLQLLYNAFLSNLFIYYCENIVCWIFYFGLTINYLHLSLQTISVNDKHS